MSQPKPTLTTCKHCSAPIMWHLGLSDRPIETTPQPTEPGVPGFVVRRSRGGRLSWELSSMLHDEHLPVHRCPSYWFSGEVVDQLHIDATEVL